VFLYTNIEYEKTAKYLSSTKSSILRGLWHSCG